MRTRAGKPKRRGRKETGAFVNGAQAIIRAMIAAGAEFRFLPGGGLVVRGLALLAPDLRGAFLDGPGAELHRAAREILTD